MKIISILLILLFLSVLSFSQKIENVHAEQQGKQVIITYDIIGAQSGQTFDVKLLYSHNGYDWKQAMNGLTGDIGSVSAGTNKMITWDVLQNLDRLVGTGFMFKVNAISNISKTDNETGTFTDSRDGKTYKWVKIGNQTWMAENLNYKISTGNWCYKNRNSNCQIYGRLYDWETATTICLKGWHLPNTNEWMELIDFLGGIYVAGGEMKQTGISNWIKSEYNTNSSGFTALPGGGLFNNGLFGSIGSDTYFWTSTELNTSDAWYQRLNYYEGVVRTGYYDKSYGFSVRCIRDN